jgi:hypothetical protein
MSGTSQILVHVSATGVCPHTSGIHLYTARLLIVDTRDTADGCFLAAGPCLPCTARTNQAGKLLHKDSNLPCCTLGKAHRHILFCPGGFPNRSELQIYTVVGNCRKMPFIVFHPLPFSPIFLPVFPISFPQ